MLSKLRSVVFPGVAAAALAVMLLGARDHEPPVQLVARVITGQLPLFDADVSMTSFFPKPHSKVQAVGLTHQPEDRRETDRAGSLRNPTELRTGVPGVRLLSPSLGRNYGTYELVELIQQVGARFSDMNDQWALEVGDLSLPRGGTIRERDGSRVHSSHRNGLDADIRYLYRDCNLTGRLDDPSCPFGVRANLEVMRMFVEGGPTDDDGAEGADAQDPSMVDVIYVGKPFQQRLCKYLAQPEVNEDRYRGVVDKLQLMGGHQAHFHVRIKCPKDSLHCPPPRLYRPDICPRLYARR